MRQNPEFLRNLWLEFSVMRLVATPLVMGLVFVLLYNSQGAGGVLAAGAVLFIGVTAAWGSGLASGALLREMQGGTWPLQRLTAIHPWPMTWGKLFGATAYAWYIGAWCLLAMVYAVWSGTEALPLVFEDGVAGPGLFEPDGLTGHDVDLYRVHPGAPARATGEGWGLINQSLPLTITFFIGIALFFHAVALMSALMQASHRKAVVRRRSLLVILAMIGLGFALMRMTEHMAGPSSVVWWGYDWPADLFWLVSLYLFVGWSLLGATMLMRKELQVPSRPWIWLGFVVFLNVYFAGILPTVALVKNTGLDETTLRFGLATATTVLLSYLMVFIEGTNVVDISRLLQRLRTPGRRGVFQEFPRWLLTTLATWLLGIGLVILIAVNDNNAWVLRDTNLYSLVLASLLFLMRDLAIVLYARFADKKERATLAAVAYLAILYYLLPWLLHVAGLHGLQYLFLPNGQSPWLLGILPALLQAGFMWMLVVRRWLREAAALPIAQS